LAVLNDVADGSKSSVPERVGFPVGAGHEAGPVAGAGKAVGGGGGLEGGRCVGAGDQLGAVEGEVEPGAGEVVVQRAEESSSTIGGNVGVGDAGAEREGAVAEGIQVVPVNSTGVANVLFEAKVDIEGRPETLSVVDKVGSFRDGRESGAGIVVTRRVADNRQGAAAERSGRIRLDDNGGDHTVGTAAAASERIKEIRVGFFVSDDIFSISRHHMQLQRLVGTQAVKRGEISMPTARKPAAISTDAPESAANNSQVVQEHVVEKLPLLKPGPEMGRSPRVAPLSEVAKQLKLLQVVGPNAEGSGADGTASEIMSGIPGLVSDGDWAVWPGLIHT